MPSITPVATERLSKILDLISNQTLYTFAVTDGQEFDQSFSYGSATVAVPGSVYPYDALGVAANAVQNRKTSWQFFHRYQVGENWTTIKNAMILAFGHNRPIALQKTLPDGTLLNAEARMTDFPDRATVDTMFRCQFTVTFEQRGDWFSADVAHPRYDTGLTYDSGQKYDLRGLLFLFTGTNNTFTLVNSGTVSERDAFLRFDGPIVGPWNLVNYACDVKGVPFPGGILGTPMQTVFNLSLLTGEWLSIDNKTNTVLSNKPGIVPWALVAKWQGQDSYFEIVPGNNSCAVGKASSAAAGSLYVAARNRFR
jgi:hypothetical protein